MDKRAEAHAFLLISLHGIWTEVVRRRQEGRSARVWERRPGRSTERGHV